MKEIMKAILTDSANIIALASLVMSTIAVLVTVIYNAVAHKQYIDNLSPLLSFKLTQHDGILYLAITNTGQSSANKIKVLIKELYNNGYRNELRLDDLFDYEFDLFPTETVQGIIGFSGENMEQRIFPYIKTDISYIKGNDKKAEKYSRDITFSRTYENRIDLKGLEDNLNSIAHSNNRIANYIEGRTLFVCDRLNTFPHNSLFKDMKDAFNNVEREELEHESSEEKNNGKQ